ncbi:ceramide synthase 4-like isoform X6 [Haemorhous mexicanus]|uniref:ceramide synthase 4-like isoform X6 n=1 Tax=Haemorhous mexicanus TaxID=30427 RepID=UPI0028BEC5FF|nr:ceramide synthase 4-like isoform X6 [Haemorhous mexicanus]
MSMELLFELKHKQEASGRWDRMARSLYEWLWQHEFWLPPGITWEDMQESEDTHYPQPRDLLLSIPFALILVVIRCAFERAIALPLCPKLGVRDKQRPKVQPNPVLETFYSTRRKNPKDGELLNLAKQCDLPVRKVEKWFRHRRNMDRPSLSKKFSEACWRFTFYIISFFTGLAVLYDKPWLWDHRECWTGYPQQGATEVASVRSCQNLPPYPAEPIPGGSKLNVPLAKAGPVRNGGNTSVIADLKRKKKKEKVFAQLYLQPEKSRLRTWERNNSADTKVSGEGGAGGAPGAGGEAPLQAVLRTKVKQMCPCSPWGSMGDAEIHPESMEEEPTPE